ncbi:very short patch repair endonuclease [Deltaproteobacteria bacterium OttesenSCG-928-K17]|nr:very short patch repair endonuclease [Deltaproteobacteria bacterium OttesenSCG-928-K17]
MDNIPPDKRSWNMSRIRSRNTGPEKALRSMLHQAGFRYRLHDKNLPGRPDLVLKKYKTVIFVHGCFWHRHNGCTNSVLPKTRGDFWKAKLDGNAARDVKNARALSVAGWTVIIVWECELKKNPRKILDAISAKLKAGV